MSAVPLDGLKVAYLFVHDLNYPRNRLVREYFEKSGADVDVYPETLIGRRNPLTPSYIKNLITLLSGYDVAVLSEFQLRYALVTGIAAKLSNTKLIVDGFVGRFETAVGDWGQTAPLSLKSFVYRAVDFSSLLVADIFIIDNDFRAQQVRSKYAARVFRKQVATLPVGAPKWAQPIDAINSVSPTGPLRVLYYGNYVPLHGVDVVLAAVSQYAKTEQIDLTLVGNGTEREKFEQNARSLGIAAICDFRDSIEEKDLRPLIASSDVVLGVFGDSPKAKSVIANKVWQGLAMGKRVVTRESPALVELRFVSSTQLLQVRPTAEGLALVLAQVSELKKNGALTEFHQTHRDFQSYIDERFADFIENVKKEVRR